MRIECKSTRTTTFNDYHSKKQHVLPVLDKRSELNVFILFSQGTDRDIQIQNFRSKHGRFSSSLQISPFPMTIVQSLFSQKFALWSLTLGPGQKSGTLNSRDPTTNRSANQQTTHHTDDASRESRKQKDAAELHSEFILSRLWHRRRLYSPGDALPRITQMPGLHRREDGGEFGVP